MNGFVAHECRQKSSCQWDEITCFIEERAE